MNRKEHIPCKRRLATHGYLYLRSSRVQAGKTSLRCSPRSASCILATVLSAHAQNYALKCQTCGAAAGAAVHVIVLVCRSLHVLWLSHACHAHSVLFLPMQSSAVHVHIRKSSTGRSLLWLDLPVNQTSQIEGQAWASNTLFCHGTQQYFSPSTIAHEPLACTSAQTRRCYAFFNFTSVIFAPGRRRCTQAAALLPFTYRACWVHDR